MSNLAALDKQRVKIIDLKSMKRAVDCAWEIAVTGTMEGMTDTFSGDNKKYYANEDKAIKMVEREIASWRKLIKSSNKFCMEILQKEVPFIFPQTFEIKSKRNRYNDGWTSDPEELYIITPGCHNQFHGIARADDGRAVQGGPLIKDLTILYARATVIAAQGGTQEEMKRYGSITVNAGDTIVFCGDRYLLVYENRYPKLIKTSK